MGDVNPLESERIPLKPREIAYAITCGNSWNILMSSCGLRTP
jgi:hypothetical protein